MKPLSKPFCWPAVPWGEEFRESFFYRFLVEHVLAVGFRKPYPYLGTRLIEPVKNTRGPSGRLLLGGRGW